MVVTSTCHTFVEASMIENGHLGHAKVKNEL